MFNHFSDAMSVTVAGGTTEENQQLCSAIQSALAGVGFRDVQIQAGDEYAPATNTDAGLISCLHRINPDLFDTPIAIQGESVSDMKMQLEGMGISTHGMSVGVGISCLPNGQYYNFQ